MRFLGYWTLAVALSISIVAAYYSIVGLAAIFAAALIPIIIMGSVLEVAKITTAVWLHMNWSNANKLIKVYLTSATIVLMLITSMGIFGFLSKAHIEQTAIGGEFQARIEQIEQRIVTEEATIERNLSQIETLATNTPNRITRIQEQIETEQGRIERILARIQPSIDEQEQIISSAEGRLQQRIQPLQDSITHSRQEILDLNNEREELLSGSNIQSETITQTIISLDEQLDRLNQQRTQIERLFSSENGTEIIQLQTLIGIPPSDRDGVVGPETTRIYTEFLSELETEISDIQIDITEARTSLSESQTLFEETRERRIAEIDTRIDELNEIILSSREQIDNLLTQPDELSVNARQQIGEIRSSSQQEIDSITEVIDSLRQQLTQITDSADQQRIASLEAAIEESRDEIMALTTERFRVESEVRSLEAEVGPIKYIAQMIYGDDSDTNTLEKSVRIVILMLVFVFDPLAIVLVISAISVLEQNPRIKKQSKTTKSRQREKKVQAKNSRKMEDVEVLDEPELVNVPLTNPIKKKSDIKVTERPKKPTATVQRKSKTSRVQKDEEENIAQTNMVIKKKD